MVVTQTIVETFLCALSYYSEEYPTPIHYNPVLLSCLPKNWHQIQLSPNKELNPKMSSKQP